MDQQRFDHLARAVSSCRSRRQVLKLLFAGPVLVSLPGRARAAQEATPEAVACAAGLTFCAESGPCVDLQTDLANCGACGSICESGLVGVECRGGECVRADCPEGIEYCGAVDLCRDLSVDPDHCGACGNACPSGVCIEGLCSDEASTCNEGQTNCGGACIDTCCDNNNCGLCGNVCPVGLTCFEGQCGCPSGLCGPITPPDTGVGGGAPVGWAAMAAASALATTLAVWSRAFGTDPK